MPQPGPHPLRARVALLAACCVVVWLAGALHHDDWNSSELRSHCALCACSATVSLVASPEVPILSLADAGRAPQLPRGDASVNGVTDSVTRAPPPACHLRSL